MASGSVQKRPGGWSIVYDVHGPDGERRQKRESGFRTKREAEARLAAVQTGIARGEAVDTSRTPLRDYLPAWLAGAKGRLRPSTHRGYDLVVRLHLVPALGHVPLNRLTPDVIERAYAGMASAGKSPALVASAHRRLSKALADATRRGLISRNPASLVTPPP